MGLTPLLPSQDRGDLQSCHSTSSYCPAYLIPVPGKKKKRHSSKIIYFNKHPVTQCFYSNCCKHYTSFERLNTSQPHSEEGERCNRHSLPIYRKLLPRRSPNPLPAGLQPAQRPTLPRSPFKPGEGVKAPMGARSERGAARHPPAGAAPEPAAPLERGRKRRERAALAPQRLPSISPSWSSRRLCSRGPEMREGTTDYSRSPVELSCAALRSRPSLRPTRPQTPSPARQTSPLPPGRLLIPSAPQARRQPPPPPGGGKMAPGQQPSGVVLVPGTCFPLGSWAVAEAALEITGSFAIFIYSFFFFN